MAKRRQKGRPVDGILILDKPAGLTSNEALQKVKHLFYAAKAGHTGSLDPLATGVLPICLGEATKFTQFLLEADKVYRSTFSFGVATETGDADGDIVSCSDASGLTAEKIEAALPAFRGEIEQIPSMYSALKHKGQPLYKLARQGIEVERKARSAMIYRFELLAFRPGEVAEADVEIHCSKGTYIRTISEDMGKALGVGAHVSSLCRSAAGPFGLDEAVTLEQLEALREGKRGEDLDFLLRPLDAAVADRLAVELPESSAWYFRRGQPVMTPVAYRDAEEGDIVRIFRDDGDFLGVGEVLDDGRVTPRRLVAGQ
ncbi:MAG: tRNA pseudouridine(55) synthase TruB [Gammaproteobacteria bacterium]|nr:MAG: tRNA pseudouridine(55) synthase TruB [Gammaproteobacteria bacterium]RLA54107.1 MAG: tRNA pseudouridine(55) synthase TruB [Gammaproteobacteria bacterium]